MTVVEPRTPFRHEAMLYADTEEFLARTMPFLQEGLKGGEAMLVLVPTPKIDILKTRLGSRAGDVHFDDMIEVGRNPGRIISRWHEFLAGRPPDGARVRGIGEPVWAGRSAAEVVECHRHEALINEAFADAAGCWVLCPYDTSELPPHSIVQALRHHPVVTDARGVRVPTAYEPAARTFDEPLGEPEGRPERFAFDGTCLSALRELVAENAWVAGFHGYRLHDIVLAANEVATNSVRYAGGRGEIRIWTRGCELTCEIRDRGYIRDPLAGRIRPEPGRTGGRGLWIANQLCDLVQVRSNASGTVVRLTARSTRDQVRATVLVEGGEQT